MKDSNERQLFRDPLPVINESWDAKLAEISAKLGALLVDSSGNPAPGASGTYVHTQLAASDHWVIEHGLGKFPAVVVVDSAGSVVEGRVQYISPDVVVVDFSAPFGGKAYL